MKKTYKIEVDCAACADKMEQAAQKTQGVAAATVSFMTQKLKAVSYTHLDVYKRQEYFLIDKEVYDKRRDLIYTGRTLFGAKPPKGQELDDHYFGPIKPRVEAYMADLNEELWKLGILAKTEHNEVAPSQHELAPIFTTTNIATDQNQLTMEIMQKVAAKHGLVLSLIHI